MMKFNLGQFLMAFKVAGKAFMYKGDKLDDLIAKAVELADAAPKRAFWPWRRRRSPTTFMKKGIDMLVDSHDADVVRAVMEKDIDLTSERHATPSRCSVPGISGPAMGMIGTLVGLVAMLANMSDPKSIGPGHGGGLADDPVWCHRGQHDCHPHRGQAGTAQRRGEQLSRTLISTPSWGSGWTEPG